MTSVLLHDDDANIKMSYKKKTKKKVHVYVLSPKIFLSHWAEI